MRNDANRNAPVLGHRDHDHAHCHDAALARAERRCDALGLRMTAQRRQVLEVLLASHVPMSAYEVMDRIAERARRPSPISVYRALDFLVANRFVHRIESRNAFLACAHEHDDAPVTGSEPSVVFLLCESCGAAGEADPPELSALVEAIAARAGFAPRSSVFEVRGLCARCRSEGRAPTQPSADAGADA